MKRWITGALAGWLVAWASIIALHVARASESGHSGGVYFEQGGNTLTVDSGGTAGVESGGTLNCKSGSTTTQSGTQTLASGSTSTLATGAALNIWGGSVKQFATTASVTQTVGTTQSGNDIVATAEDITLTLPAALKGLNYTFHVGAVSGSTGLAIHPPTGAKLYAHGFTASSGKGAICTHATASAGDVISIICDGTDWWVRSISGTWAREP
jgi:hypothetical protein